MTRGNALWRQVYSRNMKLSMYLLNMLFANDRGIENSLEIVQLKMMEETMMVSEKIRLL